MVDQLLATTLVLQANLSCFYEARVYSCKDEYVSMRTVEFIYTGSSDGEDSVSNTFSPSKGASDV